MLVSPTQNPVCKQLLEAQIKYHKLPIGKRQLQRKLKEHTKGGQRYKQAYVNKELSNSNLKLQENFGVRHEDKTIEEYWRFILFTDEAHVDPTSLCKGYIL